MDALIGRAHLHADGILHVASNAHVCNGTWHDFRLCRTRAAFVKTSDQAFECVCIPRRPAQEHKSTELRLVDYFGTLLEYEAFSY